MFLILYSSTHNGDVVIMENAPEYYPTIEIRIKECKGIVRWKNTLINNFLSQHLSFLLTRVNLLNINFIITFDHGYFAVFLYPPLITYLFCFQTVKILHRVSWDLCVQQGFYFLLMYLVTAMVPSETAGLANSPWSTNEQ